MKTARVSYWRNNKSWTVYELVFLLKELEPVPYENLDHEWQVKIKNELSDWRHFVRDGPRSLAIDECPLTTRINSSELLCWVSTLEGVVIPSVWMPLLTIGEVRKSPTLGPKAEPLGTKERKSLLLVIAALAAHARVNLTKPYAAESNGVIQLEVAQMGGTISENTIAKILNQADQVRKDPS